MGLDLEALALRAAAVLPTLPPVKQAEVLACLEFLAKQRQAGGDIKLGDHERAASEASLESFLRYVVWPVVEPETKFVGGWHIGAICEHLMAVTMGQIRDLLINVPPRHTKPVSEDAFVVERTRGRIRLREVEVGHEVLTHQGRFRRVEAVHLQGRLPVVTIETWHGRRVEAAPDHPFLSTRGWIRANDLRPGDGLAAVVPQESCGTATLTAEAARLLGYLVGDGSCGASIGVTTADDAVIADVIRCAASLDFRSRVVRRPTPNKAVFVRIGAPAPSPKGRVGRGRLPGALRLWLRAHGLDLATSYTKRVPPAISSASSEIVAEFLGAYWACDGFIAKRGYNKDGSARQDVHLGCDSVSEQLMLDVQHLLLRLGIDARVRAKTLHRATKRQGPVYRSWSLSITTMDHAARFAALVPVHHAKAALLPRYHRTGFDRTLYEDEVVSVSRTGDAECRCLTVAEDSSFTANDLAVHNSLCCSVAWPAWTWIKKPERRFLCASYSADLSTEHGVLARRVMESPLYQSAWANSFVLMWDQNVKTHYENSKRGYRISTSVGGTGIGRGGDHLLADDAHNAKSIESDTEREAVLTWYRQVWSTRFNDPKTGSRVVIMQRLHERDLSGMLLEQGGYVHLNLPTKYEPKVYITPIGWKDPRTQEGDLLCPTRMGPAEVEKAERDLGPAGFATQHQQRPAPATGTMFKTSKLRIVKLEELPAGIGFLECRGWDMAATEAGPGKDPDYTVGAKLRKYDNGLYVVMHVLRDRFEPAAGEAALRQTVVADGRACRQREEQEPGSAGKKVVSTHVRLLAGYNYRAEPSTGSKVVRAAPFAVQVDAGNVVLLEGEWNRAFIDELCLAKGSIITTDRGGVPIELVRPGDRVLTRQGWKGVRRSRCTNKSASVCEVRTVAGRSLLVTPNHPIAVGLAFKPAERLLAGDGLLSPIAASCSMPTQTAGSPIFQGSAQADATSNSTATSGSARWGRFRSAIMSTIAMATRCITRCKTCRCSRRENTCASIECGPVRARWSRLLVSYAERFASAGSAVVLTPALDVAATSSSHGAATRISTAASVNGAEHRSSRLPRQPGSVVGLVLRGWSIRASAYRRRLASGALRPSAQHFECSGFVRDTVLSPPRMLPDAVPVFNLEVDECPEFVANGILVHNCLFPNGRHDDQVDGSSTAFNDLATTPPPIRGQAASWG